MTYCISSALKRYDSGTATRLHLRAAWIVASTSSEFGPHHTRRSPDRAPAASSPWPSRFTCALSSAKVVVDGVAPPLASTTTATLSGAFCAWTARASSGAFMDRSVRGAGSVVPVLRSFAVRGVVEGFYGTPWTHEARLEVDLVPRGTGHERVRVRAQGRRRGTGPSGASRTTPPSSTQFRELAAHGDAHGVRFGFAISPGLDIDYESDADRAALLAQAAAVARRGRVAGSCCCSTTSRCNRGSRPARPALVTWLHARARRRRAHDVPDRVRRDASVAVPLGARRGHAARGRRDVDRADRVLARAARRRRARLDEGAGRPPRRSSGTTIPVNDALMTASLHLGPYQGRDADLVDVVGGVLCNPMTQAHASQIALATAMDFLADPDGYDRDASWSRAIAAVGGDRAEPLARAGPGVRRQPDRRARHPRSRAPGRRARATSSTARTGPRRSPRSAPSCGRPGRCTDAFPEPAAAGDPLGGRGRRRGRPRPAGRPRPGWPRCA